MSLKKINENPRTTDTILFEIECPGADGCFTSDPYKVDNIIVYYVERDFLGTNFGEYEEHTEDAESVAAVTAAEKVVCDNPTENNLFILEQAINLMKSKRVSNIFYYKDRSPVIIVGTAGNPAWLSSDTTNALLVNVPEDEDGNPQYGHLTYEWDAQGSVREGDYFVCWTWTPNPAGDSLSAHLPFKIDGNPRAVITIPTHITPDNKYTTLLERYLPEMYKSSISNQDITPEITQNLNKAIADGFTYLEDLTNQIIDLLDANALHESLLMYLSNLFNLRLRSSDPTLWRRQIKEAIPGFKKKGTRKGLEDAFAQSGMTLTKYTQFWQLVSPYTQQESFQYDGTTDVFDLEKPSIVTPIDDDNFGIWVRYSNDGTYDSDYTEMDKSDVTFEVGEDFILRMTWVGTSLEEGDIVRVLYEYNDVPNQSEQQLENYIRALNLADQRDETDQSFPLKNWNVYLIAEDDALFDILVPVRHSYQDPIVFGFIRTEFPYGENIYNMEEYNGCVIGKTSIVTQDGLKKIVDLKNDDLILTEYGFEEFDELKNQGIRETIKITTKTGREIIVTENHEFKVMSDSGLPKWKQTKDVNIGDFLLSKKGCESILSKGQSKNDDLWYLSGYLYGDGYLSNPNKFNWIVSESSVELNGYIQSILQKHKAKYSLFERTTEKHQKHCMFKCNESTTLIRSSSNQAPYLNSILPEYLPKGKWKENVCDKIWSASEIQIGNFLAGLFDSDGGVQKGRPVFTTKWKSLAQDIQKLLLLLGMTSSVSQYPVKYQDEERIYYRTRVLGTIKEVTKFLEKVDIQHAQKLKALKNEYMSTNVKGEQRKIQPASSVVLPHAVNLALAIFPHKKRLFGNTLERSPEEKRIVRILTRLKQGYQTTIPDNIVEDIYNVACRKGNKNNYFSFLESYVKNNWFFDPVVKIEKSGCQEVFDPINVRTHSYLSEGFVSHNSTRPSFNACHIGPEFIDPCGSCISSQFSIDVALEELSNDRILEVQDVLSEYMPFHAELHAVNFAGEIVEFVQSPVEQMDFLVTIDNTENVLSGQANSLFHRVMEDGLYSNWTITRDELADKLTVSSGLFGTGYNDYINLVVVDDILEYLGVIDHNNILEVLSPSPNAGTYIISNIKNNTARISSSVTEPFNESSFTFNLSNIMYSRISTDITQDDFFFLADDSVDFAEIGVKTQWDITNTPDYTGGSWKVSIPAYSVTPYEIIDITNGVLNIDDDGSLPISGGSGISYTLLTDLDATQTTSTSGVITVDRRGYVELNAPLLTDIESFIRIGDYLHYSSTEYEIVGFNGNDFWIADWTSGDVVGVSINTRRRLLKNSVGYFGYQGLRLTTFADHEAEFGIVNGKNPPAVVTDDNKFKENYMFKIGEQFFRILEWDKKEVKLAGREQSWTTQIAGGTALAYSLVHFPKEQINVQFVVFDHLDRDGHDVVIREIESTVDLNTAIVALSSNQGSGIQENVAQDEGIMFFIEKSNGNTEEGEI